MWHDSSICVTWLIDIWKCWAHIRWDMTHSYMWHDSSICVTWLIDIWQCWAHIRWDMTHSYKWHDSFICVTWLNDIWQCWAHILWDMTHSYMWHDSPIFLTQLMHIFDMNRVKCDMPHTYVLHNTFMCGNTVLRYYETWLIHTCDMTLSNVWLDGFICKTPLRLIRTEHDSFINLQCLRIFFKMLLELKVSGYGLGFGFYFWGLAFRFTWDLLPVELWAYYWSPSSNLNVLHNSFVCVTWLSHLCYMTDTCV